MRWSGIDRHYADLEEAVEEARSLMRSKGGGTVEIFDADGLRDRISVPPPAAAQSDAAPDTAAAASSPHSPVVQPAASATAPAATPSFVPLSQIPTVPLGLMPLIAPVASEQPHLDFAGIRVRRNEGWLELEAPSEYYRIYSYLHRMSDDAGWSLFLNLTDWLDGTVPTFDGKFGQTPATRLQLTCPHISRLLSGQLTAVDSRTFAYQPGEVVSLTGEPRDGFTIVTPGGPATRERLDNEAIIWAAEGVGAGLTIADEWKRYLFAFGWPGAASGASPPKWPAQLDDWADVIEDVARIAKSVIDVAAALGG